jgi:hypothetical protein
MYGAMNASKMNTKTTTMKTDNSVIHRYGFAKNTIVV